MMDEVEDLNRRSAYIDTIRAVGRPQRQMGLAACLVGALTLALAAVYGGGPLSPAGLAGVSAIAAGWALFVYVVVKRTRYVRAHPFEVVAKDLTR